jgi:hypothetical protein
MKEKFSTEKLEKKLKNIRIISFLIIAIGVAKLFLEDYSEFNNFASFGKLADSLIFIVLGFIVYYLLTKQLKKISGSYILFKDKGIELKIRQIEKNFEQVSELKNVNIQLKTIELNPIIGSPIIIYLDDFTEFTDKKAIKERFTQIKNKI